MDAPTSWIAQLAGLPSFIATDDIVSAITVIFCWIITYVIAKLMISWQRARSASPYIPLEPPSSRRLSLPITADTATMTDVFVTVTADAATESDPIPPTLGEDGAPGLHPLRPWNRAKPLICNPDQLGDSARSVQIA